MKSYLPGFSFFNKKSVCQLPFLDLSQGTACREIGLAGLQLPPLPLLEVAPLSTATVSTDFTASLQGSHISAAHRLSFCCHVCFFVSMIFWFFFVWLISKFDAGTKPHPTLLNVTELLHSRANVNNGLWIVLLATALHTMFA